MGRSVSASRLYRRLAARRATATLAVLVGLLLAIGSAAAQEPRAPAPKPSGASGEKAGPTPPAGVNPGAVVPGEIPPDVYYLKGKDGSLHAVLGFSIEDFEALYKLKKRLDLQEQTPRYNIERVQIVGEARGERVELTVELDIRLSESLTLDQWVRIPLRLGSAVLREPPRHAGSGDAILHFEDDREGYSCWLRGDPAEPHRLTLKMLAPLSTAGGETRLRLSTPRGAMSQLKLTVPLDRATARVIDGGELDECGPSGSGKTMISVLGVGGEMTLAWRAAAGPVAIAPAVLEATGALLARIDGRSVNTEARITVRSFGGPFDSFRLRLPPEAELVGPPQTGVSVTPLDADVAPDASAGKIVEVKLDRKTSGSVEIRLVTERPYNVTASGESLELAGFEVQGAVRQWGHIAVQVVGNWQIVWGPRHSVRQVDDLPESLRRDDLMAGFEYFVQPCSLTARMAPQKTRVSVDPEHVLYVGAERTQLRSKFKYKVRGAKIRALDIEAPGWKIDDVGPANLVNADAIASNADGTLSVPLAQPTSGDFEITLEGRHDIAKDAKAISLDIPRPIAEAMGQAIVVVLPDDNVELTPQKEALVGLAAQSLKPSMRLPDRQQDPFVYRCESSAPARFVSEFQVHAKTVAIEAVSQADVGEHEIQVEERLIYQTAYEPIDKLTLRMPPSIVFEKLQVTLDGARLTPSLAPNDAEAERRFSIIRVPLPTPRIGRFETQVSYSILQEKLLPATSVPISIPLVVPADGRLTYNQLMVAAQPGLTLSLRKGDWNVDPQPRFPATQPGQMTLTSRDASTEAPLAVTQKERQAPGSTVIDRGWIQTWLGDGLRQERVVFRFRANAPVARLQLPPGATSLEARLDNQPLLPEVDRDGAIGVRLPGAGQPREHLLELKYHFARKDWGAHAQFTAAQFGPDVWVRRLYWQVILPPRELLLFSPSAYTREFFWTWDRFGFRRQPTLEQPELEAWTGASPDWMGTSVGDLRLASANRYLFSRMGPQADLDVWTARWSRLVFGASLVTLLAGLGMIYYPAARRPAIWFVVAVALVAGGLIEPETTLLVAQAAALGVALAGLALWLAGRVRRQPAPAPPMPRTGSSVMDRAYGQLGPRSGRSGQVSTATVPLVAAAPESKS